MLPCSYKCLFQICMQSMSYLKSKVQCWVFFVRKDNGNKYMRPVTLSRSLFKGLRVSLPPTVREVLEGAMDFLHYHLPLGCWMRTTLAKGFLPKAML